MNQKVDVPIATLLSYDPKTRQVKPILVSWNGRDYPIIKIGLHHSYRVGRTLFHVFSAVSDSIFFRLVLNTDNLFWRLEEISDGLPD